MKTQILQTIFLLFPFWKNDFDAHQIRLCSQSCTLP